MRETKMAGAGNSGTTLGCEDYVVPAASFGPENPLPAFRTLPEDWLFPYFDPRAEPAERRYVGWKANGRVLPNRLQDEFNRNRVPRAFKAMVLENEFLRATVLPELGGRMVSLFDKQAGRELIERNPVFQPCNLAMRHAWFSGGVEWNVSHVGHSALTCSSVFAARVRGSAGEPVLRLYEFDRMKAFPWQIDLHLPPGSRFLFAQVRIINPHEYELPMYWWTNIAVPEAEGSRILVSAKTAFYHGYSLDQKIVDLHTIDGRDFSYPTNVPSSHSFYYRVDPKRRPWIAVLDAAGQGVFHASTSRLYGRKAFIWGMNNTGRAWQKFLSADDHKYIEIQAGLVPFQITCIPMPGGARWTWTEAFGPLDADPAGVHANDYAASCKSAESAIDRVLPPGVLKNLDSEFAPVLTKSPEQVLHKGAGWGALERRRAARQGIADPIPPELMFEEDTLGREQRPWIELLEKGRLPEPSADSSDLGQYMIQDDWLFMLERAAMEGTSDHWHAWNMIGIMRMERLDHPGARQAWSESLRQRPTSWVLRNMAKLEIQERHPEEGLRLLMEAWEKGPRFQALAVEVATTLQKHGKLDEVLRFCNALPEHLRRHERIDLAMGFAGLPFGRWDLAEKVFENGLATVRERETSLSDLWVAYHAHKLARAENVPITDELIKRAELEHPVPEHLDFK